MKRFFSVLSGLGVALLGLLAVTAITMPGTPSVAAIEYQGTVDTLLSGQVTALDRSSSTATVEGTVSFRNGPDLLTRGVWSAEALLNVSADAQGRLRFNGSGILRFRVTNAQGVAQNLIAQLRAATADINFLALGDYVVITGEVYEISLPNPEGGWTGSPNQQMTDYWATVDADILTSIASTPLEPGDLLTRIANSEATSTAAAGGRPIPTFAPSAPTVIGSGG